MERRREQPLLPKPARNIVGRSLCREDFGAPLMRQAGYLPVLMLLCRT